MYDDEKIHRWLTQKELDELLDAAFNEGVAAMHRAAQKAIANHTNSDTIRLAVQTLDLSRNRNSP